MKGKTGKTLHANVNILGEIVSIMFLIHILFIFSLSYPENVFIIIMIIEKEDLKNNKLIQSGLRLYIGNKIYDTTWVKPIPLHIMHIETKNL